MKNLSCAIDTMDVDLLMINASTQPFSPDHC